MNAKPLTDVVSPVTAAELQDWLELPTAEAKLTGILQAATEAVITHIQRDLIARDWQAVFTSVSDFRCHPSYNGYAYLELPFSELIDVESVTVDGAVLEDDDFEFDTTTTPGRLHLFGMGWNYNITVNYEAGMGANAAGINAAIKTAIKMIASYIYEHRGACEMTDALKESGALAILKRYRVERL